MSALRPGQVRAAGLTWIPYGRATPVLDRVDLAISPGERVLLAGPSGAGKSTLLLALAGVLATTAPGELSGEARTGGQAGLLVQDPRDARVAGQAGRDAAFGCENAGLPRERIAQAVQWALAAAGFPYGPDHPTSALSGGEAQRLALAGVIAPRPQVLLLDEPTAMLDRLAADRVRQAVTDVLAATGATLIVVEHRLGPWLPLVDRVVVLGATGRISHDLPAGQLAGIAAGLAAAGIWAPGVPAPRPVDVPAELLRPGSGTAPGPAPGEWLVRASEASLIRYPPRTLTRSPRLPAQVLTGVSATVTAGRSLAVRGPSGAGKSSLLGLLTGLDAPASGSVRAAPALAGRLVPEPWRWSSPHLAARIAWVPQESAHTIAGRTVRESLLATCRVLGAGEERGLALASLLGLGGALDRNPHRLSGGEKRRLALASAVAHGPRLVAFDEPTLGQDRHTWAVVAGIIAGARSAGAGVALSTHDDALLDAPGMADEHVHLERGRTR